MFNTKRKIVGWSDVGVDRSLRPARYPLSPNLFLGIRSDTVQVSGENIHKFRLIRFFWVKNGWH